VAKGLKDQLTTSIIYFLPLFGIVQPIARIQTHNLLLRALYPLPLHHIVNCAKLYNAIHFILKRIDLVINI